MDEATREGDSGFDRSAVMSTYDATLAQSIVLHTSDVTEGFLRAVYRPEADITPQDIAMQLDDHYSEIAAMNELQRRNEAWRELASLVMRVSTGQQLMLVDNNTRPIIDEATSAALDLLLAPVYRELDELQDELSDEFIPDSQQQEDPPENLDLDRYTDLYPEARCRDADPEVFFPDAGGDVNPAKKICADCPVITECFDAAVTNGERFGVFGDSSENDRRKIKKQLHNMHADTWENLDNRQRQEVLRRAGILHRSYFSDEGDSQQGA